MEVSRILELENRIKLLESEKYDYKNKLDEVYKTINGRVNSIIAREREEITQKAQFELHQYYSSCMDENFMLKKEINALKKYIENIEKCNLEADNIMPNNIDVINIQGTPIVLQSKCNFVTKDNNSISFSNRVDADKQNLRNYNKKYDTSIMVELRNNGLTFEQMASRVGCSVRTVKRRIEKECTGKDGIWKMKEI